VIEIATTLGETAAAVTDQLGADASAWTTGEAGLLGALTDVCAAAGASTSARVAAYVPELARTAARTATVPSSASLRGLAG